MRLIQRTTHARTLTNEGRTYSAHVRGLLDVVEEAALAVRPGAAVRDTLQIAAPPGLCAPASDAAHGPVSGGASGSAHRLGPRRPAG